MFVMKSTHRSIFVNVFSQQIRLQALKSWSVIAWFQSYFLLSINGFAEERIATQGDRVSLSCNILSSPGSSVLWLYTPGEAYQGIQHIYTDGRMVSGWRSICHVTTNATSSIFVLYSVHQSNAGYYECSEEDFDDKDIRSRVKLTVLDAEGSTPNIDEIFDVFRNYILIFGAFLTVLLLFCTLFILQRRRLYINEKAMDRRTSQVEMTKCGINQDETTTPSLLLSQSAKKHSLVSSDRNSFLESDNDLKAP